MIISSVVEKTSCEWHHMDGVQGKKGTVILSDRKSEGPGESPVLFHIKDPLERIKSGSHQFFFKPEDLPVDPTFYGFHDPQ